MKRTVNTMYSLETPKIKDNRDRIFLEIAPPNVYETPCLLFVVASASDDTAVFCRCASALSLEGEQHIA